jgi:carbon-monoxide dehydrogenase medium subunit
MKPAPFECLVPDTLEETLEALRQHGDAARLIAGGQSLVPMMSLRIARSEVLVDLNRVDGLGACQVSQGSLSLGSMLRQSELLQSEPIAEGAPLLREACRWVGYPTTRNRGTLGGSAAHADPAAELPAALLALDAEFVLRSAKTERLVGARDFFVDYFTTALAPEECLAEVRVPVTPGDARSVFLEVARRKHDFPLCGVAVVLRRAADGTCGDLRVALCGAGARPLRAERVEAALRGETLDAARIHEASAEAHDEVEPLSDVHGSEQYRRELAVTLTRRAIAAAAEVETTVAKR